MLTYDLESGLELSGGRPVLVDVRKPNTREKTTNSEGPHVFNWVIRLVIVDGKDSLCEVVAHEELDGIEKLEEKIKGKLKKRGIEG
jgi:preprotein translocase subunit SecD